ncbi:MAG: CPBP family intramembrane metalloprotease [Oscillospiraceae bacterium]|nr:CPBP family intramembrane metalloprotease [Oscillospiraceae bacterium]
MKKALGFSLKMLPFALLGGVLVGMYTFEYYTADMRELLLQQIGNYKMYLLICATQSVVYGLFCSFFGFILSNKIGLLKPLHFEKKTVLWVSGITAILGILFASDYWIFGSFLPEVAAEYDKGISSAYFFGSLIYGGIIEELMMRFFLMSLLVLLLWKVAARTYCKESIPEWIFITANVCTALLFAAGHLPTTISLFGRLTPLVVFRCFLLNGSFGLVFGRFYRKYGIQYAMLCHFGCHLVSKLILLTVL